MLIVSDIFNVGRSTFERAFGHEEPLEDLDFEEAKVKILKLKEIEVTELALVSLGGLAFSVHMFATALFAFNIPLIFFGYLFSSFFYDSVAASSTIKGQLRNPDQWKDITNLQDLRLEMSFTSMFAIRDNMPYFFSSPEKRAELDETIALREKKQKLQREIEVQIKVLEALTGTRHAQEQD